jgi:hypothetical protein
MLLRLDQEELLALLHWGRLEMSGLRSFLSNLSPFKAMFLFCVAMGVVTAVLGGLVGASGGPNIGFALIAFAT